MTDQLQDCIEAILTTRIMKGRLDGYTLETAKEIADAAREEGRRHPTALDLITLWTREVKALSETGGAEQFTVPDDFMLISADQLKGVIERAAANPFEQPCYECGSTEILGPICADCNPSLAAQVRGRCSPSEGVDDDEERREAWSDFECDYLTDGKGNASADVYRRCREAFETTWPLGRERAIDAARACVPTRDEAALPEAAQYGYTYYNPDTGFEWAESHPIDSGEVSDAQDVRPSTQAEQIFASAWYKSLVNNPVAGDYAAPRTEPKTELPEAVAWRFRSPEYGGTAPRWVYSDAEPKIAPDRGYTVQPLYAAPQPSTELPADVVRLVIAARNVAFEDHPSPEALRELDQASEAFADRVPLDNEGEGR